MASFRCIRFLSGRKGEAKPARCPFGASFTLELLVSCLLPPDLLAVVFVKWEGPVPSPLRTRGWADPRAGLESWYRGGIAVRVC